MKLSHKTAHSRRGLTTEHEVSPPPAGSLRLVRQRARLM